MKQSEADRAVEFFNTSNEVVATDADGAFELAVDSVSVVFGGNEVVRAETFSDDIRIVLRPAKQGDTLVAVKVTSSCSQGGQPCTGFWSAVKWIRVSDPPGALAVSLGASQAGDLVEHTLEFELTSSGVVPTPFKVKIKRRSK
ncbi:MAG: hypothetical protein KC468_36360 [Myxococcales bacterium]|nr:hypothetical protein [Myxococcales bacterium]